MAILIFAALIYALEIEWFHIALLCAAAFLAGFVDAVVGGGGLIQTPFALILLPAHPVATIIGSLKIPSFSGTFFAAIQYMRQVKMVWWLLSVACTLSFFAAYVGSLLLTQVSNSFMKPVLLVVLTGVAIYTYSKKNFGQHAVKNHSRRQQFWYVVAISLTIGFYDGFIGPGAGAF